MQKIIMLFTWFIRFGFANPKDDYSIHDYIKTRFCPEFMQAEEFDEKEQLIRDTPGPAGIKYAYYVGNKVCGIFGAIVAIFALLVPVIAAGVILYYAYGFLFNGDNFFNTLTHHAIGGAHAVTLGLIVAQFYKIIYFNKMNRKSLLVILPAGLIFIVLSYIANLSAAIMLPIYIAAIFGFGTLFGFIHDFTVKYRIKHPKYIDPHSKKGKKLRDRQLQEEEEALRKYMEDEPLKILKDELDKKFKNKKHRGDE